MYMHMPVTSLLLYFCHYTDLIIRASSQMHFSVKKIVYLKMKTNVLLNISKKLVDGE